MEFNRYKAIAAFNKKVRAAEEAYYWSKIHARKIAEGEGLMAKWARRILESDNDHRTIIRMFSVVSRDITESSRWIAHRANNELEELFGVRPIRESRVYSVENTPFGAKGAEIDIWVLTYVE